MDSTILIGIITLVGTILISFMAWVGNAIVKMGKEIAVFGHRINNQQATEQALHERFDFIEKDVHSLKVDMAVIKEKFEHWERE